MSREGRFFHLLQTWKIAGMVEIFLICYVKNWKCDGKNSKKAKRACSFIIEFRVLRQGAIFIILGLFQTILLNPKVQPICLPDKPVDYSDNREGDLVTITGWGLQKLRTMRKDWSLREAQVSVFSQK